MKLDYDLQFSNAQVVTVDADSTNSINLGPVGFVGPGETLAVVITMAADADFTTGDEAIVINLETDDNSSFSSGTVIATSGTILGSAATAGSQFVILFPYTNEQYVQLQYDVSGASPSFTIDAHLTQAAMVDTASRTSYPSGFTVG